MRAARVLRHGDLDLLVVEELPDPVRASGQVLVDVSAVGLNAYELLVFEDRYQVSVPVPARSSSNSMPMPRQ